PCGRTRGDRDLERRCGDRLAGRGGHGTGHDAGTRRSARGEVPRGPRRGRRLDGVRTPADRSAAVTRVLLADDHPAVRAGIRLILTDGGFDVVGEAGDGAEAVRLARELDADVVLMDIRMPGVDGIQATRDIVAEGTADVLVLTSFDIDEYVFA